MDAATQEQFSHDNHSPDSAACLAALPWTAARHAEAAEPPLVIAKTGYLFVGGKIDTSLPGSPMVGQMYVEYQIPQKLRHPYPIVMIHGGSQTGTNFTGTPDGREGWAQYFVRRGYAVYVVDQVARGRAAHWSQVARAGGRRPISSASSSASPRRSAPSCGRRRSCTPNGRARASRAIRSSTSSTPSQFPSLVDFAKQQELNRDAGVALLDKIGPAIAADPFAVRRVRLADRRHAAEPGEGDRRGRAERPAGPRDRVQGRARLVRRHAAQDQALRPRRRAAHLRSAAQGRRRSSPSCARTRPTSPIWCAAGCRPSRRAS